MGDKLYNIANSVIYVNAALSWGTIFGWIQLGLGILLTLVGIAYKVWKWYKEANADGKITGDEIKQVIEENKDDVAKVVDNIEELVEDIKENTKKD